MSDKFPPKLSLSFVQWQEIYDDSKDNCKLQNLVLAEMNKTASIFKEWAKIYKDSEGGSEIERSAIAGMGRTASTLAEWIATCEASYEGSETRKLAFAEIEAFDLSPEVWWVIERLIIDLEDELTEFIAEKAKG